ncbi:MFS general substrate transporter [Metschnikowia bicuspidata]|uniref:MFS general substrate transporter n=1 Tax=Metschnikowia bicuspidata TaxID=27322 RepID=A0A4P9ZCU9_9ASCO|nr:MFS general substrate transporter [Metschnikowia bicuspidata]
MVPVPCLTPTVGNFPVAFGRKPVLLVVLLLFEASSLLSGLSHSLSMLLAGRVLSGLGVSEVIAMALVVLSESVPITRKSMPSSIIGVVYFIASVAGPLVGGVLTGKTTWRWCFYGNLPIGTAALVLLLLSYRSSAPKQGWKAKLTAVDYMGSFLFVTGVFLVLLELITGGVGLSWISPALVCFLAIGIVSPLIDGKLVGVPQVAAATISGAFGFAFFFAVTSLMAIYLRMALNATLFPAGLDMVPLVVTVAISVISNGIFMRCTLCVPLSISFDLLFQSNLLASQLKAPAHITASMIDITTFLQYMRTLGALVGVVTSQNLLYTRAKLVLDRVIAQYSAFGALRDVSTKDLLKSPLIIWSLPQNPRNTVLKALMDLFKDALYLNLAFAVVPPVAALLTTNMRIPHHDDIAYVEPAPTTRPFWQTD